MPTDTQRAATREEMDAVGQDIHDWLLSFENGAESCYAAGKLGDSHMYEGATADRNRARNALIIAIAKRVREAAERATEGWRRREAAACPEDMDFEDYIAHLQGKIRDAVTGLRATEAPAYPEPCSYCGEAVTVFDRHDECGNELSKWPVDAARTPEAPHA